MCAKWKSLSPYWIEHSKSAVKKTVARKHQKQKQIVAIPSDEMLLQIGLSMFKIVDCYNYVELSMRLIHRISNAMEKNRFIRVKIDWQWCFFDEQNRSFDSIKLSLKQPV